MTRYRVYFDNAPFRCAELAAGSPQDAAMRSYQLQMQDLLHDSFSSLDDLPVWDVTLVEEMDTCTE